MIEALKFLLGASTPTAESRQKNIELANQIINKIDRIAANAKANDKLKHMNGHGGTNGLVRRNASRA